VVVEVWEAKETIVVLVNPGAVIAVVGHPFPPVPVGAE